MIWVDAHLSPAIATWITTTFGIPALALRLNSNRCHRYPLCC